MIYTELAPQIALFVIVFANVVTSICFLLVFYAQLHHMTWLHRAAYIAIIAGLSINVLLFFLGKHEPNVGEIVASLGWALLGYIAVSRNAAEVLRRMRIDFWV